MGRRLLAIVLFGFAALAAPAAAQAATLSVEPDSGAAGEAITASGDGYAACTRRKSAISLYWDDGRLAQEVDGDPFTTSFDVPGDFAPGERLLIARCTFTGADGRELARAPFTVVEPEPDPAPPEEREPRAEPSLLVEPSTPRQGDKLLLRAKDFPTEPCDRGRIEFYLDERRLDFTFERDDPRDALARSRVPKDTPPGGHAIHGRCGREYAAQAIEVRAAGAPKKAREKGDDAAGGPGAEGPEERGEAGAPAEVGEEHPNAVELTSSVPTPDELPLAGPALAASFLLAVLIVLLVAFPAELFNKTYEENEEEIHGMLARVGLRHRHPPPAVGFALFVVLGAALMAWLALDEGSEGNPVAVAVGLLVALPVVTFAFRLPTELYTRARTRIGGRLHVFPAALAVALVCALLSRALGLEPPYLYGLVAGFAAVRSEQVFTREHKGKGTLVGVACLSVIALACWWAWGALDAEAHGEHREMPVILLATTLFWVFVLSAEGLVFALVPLRFLDGALLRGWRTAAWIVPQLIAAVFFVYVLLLHGRHEEVDSFDELIRPLAFFAVFGLASFAFWAYFRWHGRPTARPPAPPVG